jgi:hypothetical protein
MNPKLHFHKSSRKYGPMPDRAPEPTTIAGVHGGFYSDLSMRPDAPIDPKFIVTAQIMGDPPPGRSALDQQRMQVGNVERGAPRGAYTRKELH